MQEYAVGFLHNDHDVALIRKNRPQWQAGFLNGIGGKIEPGETPHDAMVRECKEEAGRFIGPWDHFLTLEGTTARVFCFAIYDEQNDHIYKLETQEDEPIEVWAMNSLNTGWIRNTLEGGVRETIDSTTVPNLQWIIPLMRQRAKYSKPITIDFHGDA
jgi:8-oxo-dGTP pyrophosphatase MutT (NUDIX family)